MHDYMNDYIIFRMRGAGVRAVVETCTFAREFIHASELRLRLLPAQEPAQELLNAVLCALAPHVKIEKSAFSFIGHYYRDPAPKCISSCLYFLGGDLGGSHGASEKKREICEPFLGALGAILGQDPLSGVNIRVRGEMSPISAHELMEWQLHGVRPRPYCPNLFRVLT